MKNYKNSSYAANKYSKDIVYNSEVSGTTSITLKDFLKSDPTLTEADFERWKNWSDNDYKEESNITNLHTRKDISLTSLGEVVADFGIPLEVAYEEAEIERTNHIAIRKALKMLYDDSGFTEKMKKRFEMYIFQGMNCEKIGEALGVDAKPVRCSVKSALKKFKVYFMICLEELK